MLPILDILERALPFDHLSGQAKQMPDVPDDGALSIDGGVGEGFDNNPKANNRNKDRLPLKEGIGGIVVEEMSLEKDEANTSRVRTKV